mgnify:CR=1 FL=1
MKDLKQLEIVQKHIIESQFKVGVYYDQDVSKSTQRCAKNTEKAFINAHEKLQLLNKKTKVFQGLKMNDVENVLSELKENIVKAHQSKSDEDSNALAQFLYDLDAINSHDDLIESYANKEAYERELERNQALEKQHQKELSALKQEHATETKRLRREVAEMQQKFNRLNELEKFLKREKKRQKAEQKRRQIERALREKAQLKPLFLSILDEEENQIIVEKLSKVIQQFKDEEEAALVIDDASKE